MVPFAGYAMPVQYSGIVAEHKQVREQVGIFDVSHMGQMEFHGADALAFVDSLVTNAAHKLENGRALYTVCCNKEGTILDDLIVYRLADDEVLVICNASNRDKIRAHFQSEIDKRGNGLRFADTSDSYALLALQGPKAESVLNKVTPLANELKFFGVNRTTISLGGHDVELTIARTGYTGEDGFELLINNENALALWNALFEAGEEFGLQAIGLGARDTLRLEAKLCLYGNDIDETTDPYEAGLAWVVKLDGPDFVGKEALVAKKAAGKTRRLVGFEMTGRGVARHGYPVVLDGKEIGKVTSGSPAPTLGKNIGLAYVPVEHAKSGTEFKIQIRAKEVDAQVVKTPFYKRPTN